MVERLELEFSSGLTILTGETGAGKSILVDALGLVLGERADSSMVRHGREQAEVSAAFDVTPAVAAWLQANDFVSSADEECVARRVVTASGRSRCYLNGRMATVQALRELAENLVDIHSQHAHQSLLKPETQRQLLDNLAPDTTPLEHTRVAYARWRELHHALAGMGGDVAERQQQIQLLRYQAQELEALRPEPSGLAELDSEHRRLAHAAQLLETGQRVCDLLDHEDGMSAASALRTAGRELDSVLAHDHKLTPMRELLDSALIQTSETAEELRRYLTALEIDPQRLRDLENRIAVLQDAARKHQVRIEELPALLERLQQRLHALENFEERAAALEQELLAALHTYRATAAALSHQRVATAQQVGAQVTANIRELGMPKGHFVVAINHHADAAPSPTGTDHIEFQVTANPGQAPGPLHKVASGGELSRISLAIQVIAAQQSGVETLIFDEVDVGVGGRVAEIIGQKLAQLAKDRQVLCITHLPQVAVHGHHHLRVSKISTDTKAYSELRLLSAQEQVEEIARMLGGRDITATTLQHAQELLNHAQQSAVRGGEPIHG